MSTSPAKWHRFGYIADNKAHTSGFLGPLGELLMVPIKLVVGAIIGFILTYIAMLIFFPAGVVMGVLCFFVVFIWAFKMHDRGLFSGACPHCERPLYMATARGNCPTCLHRIVVENGEYVEIV